MWENIGLPGQMSLVPAHRAVSGRLSCGRASVARRAEVEAQAQHYRRTGLTWAQRWSCWAVLVSWFWPAHRPLAKWPTIEDGLVHGLWVPLTGGLRYNKVLCMLCQQPAT